MTLGSQELLRRAVGHRPELLLAALRRAGALGRREKVTWVSPLMSEAFREYKDGAALEKLGLGRLKESLCAFWPAQGPVWDALGLAGDGRPILLEAKAHIPEAVSPGSKASEKSLELIRSSLRATRAWIAPRARGDADWSQSFYQYANRLAYQHFLSLNSVPSSLVFLNFTNAVDMDGPASEWEWEGAIRLIHAVLGLPADLKAFAVFHAFLDSRELTDL